ncbi:MAG: hypothetical protein KM310_00210 [Clostridiales bacterium]|nr:hypothetical protein [Clostridiales bacterium]
MRFGFLAEVEAYREYAETIIEGRHTERERMLAEMVLELCEKFERLFHPKRETED